MKSVLGNLITTGWLITILYLLYSYFWPLLIALLFVLICFLKRSHGHPRTPLATGSTKRIRKRQKEKELSQQGNSFPPHPNWACVKISFRKSKYPQNSLTPVVYTVITCHQIRFNSDRNSMIVDLIILGMILIRLTLEDEKLHVHVTF